MSAQRKSATRRVLVVDDDATYRLIITKTLETIEGVEVVAVAGTVALAKAKIQRGNIDLVTIDVVLRDESGFELVEWIKQNHPHLTMVLVTAGSENNGRQTVDALLLGVSALVLKPQSGDERALLGTALRRALDGVLRRDSPQSSSPKILAQARAAVRQVIAIGASTGGPPVVLQLLRSLPPTFDVPILITQHMPAAHIPYFVDLLAVQSGRRVVAAVHGMVIEPGVTYVASEGRHMRLARSMNRLILTQDAGPEEHHCRPAVDPLFRSVAEICGAETIGVVISGMGCDGAQGAVALRAHGAPVVVQDRETSVVWGMPGAVVAAADVVAPANELAGWIVRWTISHVGGPRT